MQSFFFLNSRQYTVYTETYSVISTPNICPNKVFFFFNADESDMDAIDF